MRISDIIGMCFKNLWRRKVRTLLTVLGVVIGSCAIIVMISLGIGTNKSLEYSLSQMGDLHVITIYGNDSGMSYSDNGGSDQDQAPQLTAETVNGLKEIDGVTAVLPKLQIDGDMVSLYAGKNGRYKSNWMSVYGVYPENLEDFGLKFADGGIPAEGGNYIIFGSQAAYQFRDTRKRDNNMVWKEELPDGTVRQPFFNPMDENILLTINNKNKPDDKDDYGGYLSGGKKYEHKLKVAGVLQDDEQDYENTWSVFIPMTFAEQILADSNRLNNVKEKKDTVFQSVQIYCKNLDDVTNVQKVIDDMQFNSFSMDTIRQQMQGQVVQQQMLLGGLAAISLFVAAIGITNTMIMSIYERTREIGVMKVLGCFIKNIRQIFLLEAGCIGFLGGVIGSIISFIISAILNLTSNGSSQQMGMMYMGDVDTPVKMSIIPPWLVLLALAFSTAIGLISGFYPANRAVKISALEAIKNE